MCKYKHRNKKSSDDEMQLKAREVKKMNRKVFDLK